MDKVIVISSDCHGGIPRDEYRAYLEPRYHADLDQYMETLKAWDEAAQPFPVDVVADREEVAYRSNFMDSAGRLRDLEERGVVGEVIFPGATPGTSPPWSDYLSAASFRARTPRTRELQWAGERAYNRWLADFCGDEPGRRAGLAFVPLDDVPAAVEEIHWAADRGLKGIVLPFMNYDLPEYCHGWYWDPIWAACAATGLSLNFHGGHGYPALGTHSAVSWMELKFYGQRPLWQLIISAVFDRFPALKFAITEATALWIPELMEQLDGLVAGLKESLPKKTLMLKDYDLPEHTPSEYWTSNCFVGVSLIKLNEMQRRDEIGVSTMMYGVDYPHPEGTWGQATTWMQAALGTAGVSEPEARLMLGENAARLYHLDLDELGAAAARVGPTVADVLAVPDDAKVRGLLDDAYATGMDLAAMHYEDKSLL